MNRTIMLVMCAVSLFSRHVHIASLACEMQLTRSSLLVSVTCHSEQMRKSITVNGLFVGCLLTVPVTCKCISGTDLLGQVYVLLY